MQKICAIDLDGVLCEYPEAWINFVNSETNNQYIFSNLEDIKNKLTYELYRKIKQKYRLSGIKANLKPVYQAKKFTTMLRDNGYIIVILTARPIYNVPQVFRDTVSWLKKNNIAYDTIFYGKDKHIKIIKYFPNINFVVEDNSDIANSIATMGHKVYLLDSLYNQFETKNGVHRVTTLMEIINIEGMKNEKPN